jgi:CRISPR/Cas system-associated exonuclease Cas4 (RecB family)
MTAAAVLGEVLSPSQASTYLGCSAKWWFRYGLGLPDPAGGGAVRGKAVHSIVAYYLEAKRAGVRLDLAEMKPAWDWAWDEAAEGAEFAAFEDIDALKRSGEALAAKYIAEAAPAIEPAAVEVPFTGEIAGVAVRGIADIVTTSGMVIDIKTTGRKPSKLAHDHAFQLATYAACVPGASGETRLDSLVSTTTPQLIQLEHTPGEAGRRMIERLYPMVADGIAGGLFTPNRASTLCSRRHCAFAAACEREFGGTVE